MARPGRRPGSGNSTREQILKAARDQFAEQGYGETTIRGIASAAGVNAALVHHYFGAKEQVFAAAMELPFQPEEVVNHILDGPQNELGERFVRLYLRLWEDQDNRTPFFALLRSVTTNDQAAALLREFMDRAVFGRVSERLGVPRLRLNAAFSQVVGLALGRYVIGVEPLAHSGTEEIVELVAPVIQYYVGGSGDRLDAPIQHVEN